MERSNKLLLLLGRIEVLRTSMRPTVTDRVAWRACLSVCHSSKPCENGGTDRDAVWELDSGGPEVIG